jgi:hypothetical protein
MEFSAIFGPLVAGPHRLTLENRHLTTMSVYLINAAKPRFSTVQITRQKRSENQSAGEIEFTFGGSAVSGEHISSVEAASHCYRRSSGEPL